MKRIILSLILSLIASAADAGVSCSVPFQLQNGVTADATQVMANYNALITCLTNAAAAGANNDITSLSALSTPITPTQGGTTTYVGGTSSGTNAQIVSATTPSNFALVSGRRVQWVVGAGNTGPTTLNVASSGNVNLFRRTQLGISAMVGGELVAGHTVIAEYDGTEWQCLTCSTALVGEIRNFSGPTAPAGWHFIDGSCQVRTTYPDLFSVISTTYDPTGSTCDVAHFALPDGRGRLLAGQDNMGGVAANRMTNAGSGCTGTTLGGAGCGAQNHTLTQSEIPTGLFTMNDPGHTHNLLASGHNVALLDSTSPGTLAYSAAGSPDSLAPSTSTVQSATTGITLTDHAGGLSHAILNPLQVVTKIIKL